MPRLLAFLLALSLGLALTAGAAFAETKDKPPGNKGSQERLAFCDNAYSGCIKLNCQDLPTVAQGEACVSQCNGIRDDCNAARLGGTVDALETGLNLSTMALEGIRLDLVEVDLGGIGNRWTTAWGDTERGFVLNRTNGFNGLIRFLQDAYLELVKSEPRVVSIDEFASIFRDMKIESADFIIGNFPPGSSGASLIYKSLLARRVVS